MSDYVDGALPDQELAVMTKHLAVCESCTRKAAQWTALLHRLHEMSAVTAPAYLEHLVVTQVTRRYRRPWRTKLQSLYEDLVHPLRMIEGRDLLIALAALPIALSFFLAIFLYIQVSILNAEQITLLTYTTSHDFPATAPSLDAAPESDTDSLMPVGISGPSLIRFVESTVETGTSDNYFKVMVHVTREGDGNIEEVIDQPHDSAILYKFNSLLSSVKFRPARLRGKRVDSHFVLSFSHVNVLG